MARRSFWKGYLKLSLVTCPVAMSPVVSERDKVRFHTLNRATGHRIETRYVDADTGKVVDDDDQVKGYARGENDYVMLEDEELDTVALESTRTIDIEMFVPRQAVQWIWYDVPHFLMPDDEVGEEAFSVIREAMRDTGMVGISRLVLYRRERAIMLEPRGRGIVLWTLRYGDEVRDEKEYFKDLGREPVDPKMLDMVKGLIAERTTAWTPDLVEDPVQNNLVHLIRAKEKGQARKPAPTRKAAPAGNNVIDLMAALKQSLDETPPRPKKRR